MSASRSLQVHATPLKSRIALVVPDPVLDGGVPAIACRVQHTIMRSRRRRFRLISLCMSWTAPSQRLYQRTVFVATRGYNGISRVGASRYTHIGAVAGESTAFLITRMQVHGR